MSTGKPHESPCEVCAEAGEVIVDGPAGVAISFTADAAIETSDRLMTAGLKAKGHEVEGDHEDPAQAHRR